MWQLGIILFEMLEGFSPFYDMSQSQIKRNILTKDLRISKNISKDVRSLLCGLLEKDPTRRLGSRGIAEVKSHRAFKSINWKNLLIKEVRPPYLPEKN